jgi:hypothetical protein
MMMSAYAIASFWPDAVIIAVIVLAFLLIGLPQLARLLGHGKRALEEQASEIDDAYHEGMLLPPPDPSLIVPVRQKRTTHTQGDSYDG